MTEPSNCSSDRQIFKDEETNSTTADQLLNENEKIINDWRRWLMLRASRAPSPHFYKGDFFLTSRCYDLDILYSMPQKGKILILAMTFLEKLE